MVATRIGAAGILAPSGLLANTGTTNVEIYGGAQCDAKGADCRAPPARRLYAGTQWEQPIDPARSVEYRSRRGCGWSRSGFEPGRSAKRMCDDAGRTRVVRAQENMMRFVQIEILPTGKALVSIDKLTHAVPVSEGGGTRLFLGAQHLDVPHSLEELENVLAGRERKDAGDGGRAGFQFG